MNGCLTPCVLLMTLTLTFWDAQCDSFLSSGRRMVRNHLSRQTFSFGFLVYRARKIHASDNAQFKSAVVQLYSNYSSLAERRGSQRCFGPALPGPAQHAARAARAEDPTPCNTTLCTAETGRRSTLTCFCLRASLWQSVAYHRDPEECQIVTHGSSLLGRHGS